MNSKMLIGAVGVLVGLAGGYVFFNPESSIQMNDENHYEMSEGDDHSHAMIEVDPSLPSPTVNVEVMPDAKDGYNVLMTFSNYKLTPEHVNQAPVQGEGHAHIFVNGTKIGRVYGEWYHLPATHFREGENVIDVTLNANDHSDWIKDGRHIVESVTVRK